jgi:hypothetical protein
LDWALVDTPNGCGDLSERKKKSNNKLSVSEKHNNILFTLMIKRFRH